MNKQKISYIEYLRVISCVAVIVIHVFMTLPNNYTIDQLGKYPFMVFHSGHMLVNWAVPVFFMVSGSLLIPKKNTYNKIGKYLARMFFVLLTFGVVFAFLELLFNNEPISVLTIGKSIILTLEGKSWNHMWYVYVMIGIYLILLPFSRGIQNMTVSELRIFVGTLVFGYGVISSINACSGLSLQNYMQLKNQMLWFILGYYITVEPAFRKVQKPVVLYPVMFVGGV